MTFARTISIVFFFLGISLLTSMAGLELSATLTFVFAVIAFFKKKQSPAFLKADILACLPLLFVSLGSVLYFENRGELYHVLDWYRGAIFLFSAAYLLRIFPDLKQNLIEGLYVGAFLAFLNGIFQYFTHYDFMRGHSIHYFADMALETTRVTGFFNLPTTFGYVLAMFLIVPLCLFFFDSDNKRKLLHSLMFLMGYCTLLMTYTRGAWISFAAGLFTLALISYRKYLLPVLMTLIVVTMTATLTNKGFNERFNSIFSTDYYSNLQRLELWKANFQMFSEHPIFGIGLHRNDFLVAEYHEKMNHSEKIVSHAHNSYIQFLSGTGLIGLFCFLLFLGSFVWSGYTLTRTKDENKRRLARGLFSVLIIFMVCCLFDCNFRDAEVRYSFFTYMALIVACRKES